MDGVEPASWGWKLLWRRLEMLWSLDKMTLMAVVYSGLHSVKDPPPDEVGAQATA